jgi:hypothetical protein
MPSASYQVFDPLFPDGLADQMIRLCERFGSYGMYSEEGIEDDFAPGLTRTNYFRETYAYGAELMLPGIEAFQWHQGFLDGARKLQGRPVVRPAIVYANILVPGQELAVHTDVPEFRGMNRTKDPQWLLVAMHHSGLFERWRMTIVTGVAYFHGCDGGEFVFYPDGRDGEPRTLGVKHNSAVLLDTDSVFHGVDRVSETQTPIPALRPGMRLTYEENGTWRAGPDGEALARYRWGELRFSVSWKAYCYADEAEERCVRERSDDLTREAAVERLVQDLRERGRLGDTLPERRELALLIIDEYVQFPPTRAAAEPPSPA